MLDNFKDLISEQDNRDTFVILTFSNSLNPTLQIIFGFAYHILHKS